MLQVSNNLMPPHKLLAQSRALVKHVPKVDTDRVPIMHAIESNVHYGSSSLEIEQNSLILTSTRRYRRGRGREVR